MAKDVPGAAKADVANGLAELSPEDRAAAIKQGVCPVSGEPLGSMGKPAKVTVKGQTVFLCCPGCEEDLRKEPDKFLAKLKSGRGK
jgi:YHS domain-containing protein